MGAPDDMRRHVSTGIAGAAGLIAVTTLLARIAGFGRVIVFADAVRAGGVGAIYQSVNALPNVVFEVAAGGILAAVAVPLIARSLGAGDRERADALASVLLTWCLLVLVPLAVLVLLLAGPISAFFVPGSDPVAGEVAARMLRVFAAQIPLYGVGIVLTGVLHAHRRFLAAALAPLLSSVVVLASYLWYGHLAQGRTLPGEVPDTALTVLAWGTTAGVAVLSLPLAVPAWRTGWRWRPTLAMHPGDRRRIAALAGGGLLALLAQQVAVVVTVWVAGHRGGDGVFPVYQYLQTVYLLPYAVLAVPVAMSAFPALAHGHGAGEDNADVVAGSLRWVILLTGLAVGVLFAAAPAVGAFFTLSDARRGTAGASPAALAALPGGLIAYAPGLIGLSVAALLTRALYVRGHPTTAGAAVALGWVLAAVVPLVATSAADGPGPALRTLGLASSAGMTVSAVALVLLVRRHWGSAALQGSGRTLATVVVAIAAGAAVGDTLTHNWPRDTWPTVITAGLVSAISALLAGLLVVLIGDRATLLSVRTRARRAPGNEYGAGGGR